MLKKFVFFVAAVTLSLFCGMSFVACSDDDSSVEFLFDREVSELSVIRKCASDADSGAYCYQIRFHYPIATDALSKIYVWVDSTVVGDTAKAVNDDQLKKATLSFSYESDSPYDTIDLTPYVKEYVKERDSLMVAIYCQYSDDEDPGAVQRVYLHFGDDIPPSQVAVYDSVWTTGALFEWYRPTDQTDFYAPNELSGKIVGYNIVIYSSDVNEDLRNLWVRVDTPEGTDNSGKTLYRRHARIRSNNDSTWIGDVSHDDNAKNYLRLTIKDSSGYDMDNYENNKFRLIIDGLRSESSYTFGISSWDSAGNASGTEATSSVTTNMLFITTDSIAPVIANTIFTIEDSLFPGKARLDSNNRLRIFWSKSIDPLKEPHGIKTDSLVRIPGSCGERICYRDVASYKIEYYDRSHKNWVDYGYVGGSGRYNKYYQFEGKSVEVVADGVDRDGVSALVTDTIRWVAPGDTLILRIRSIDSSGYYSRALIDTIYVSLGELAKQVECPKGFIAVKASDSLVFCMERYEHRNDSGKFMTGVLHSEAVDACNSVSASGFKVGLCKERDWELVCLSGGTLSYGVIEEEMTDASEYLFASCNVGTNDSISAESISTRSARCMNPMGVFDMAGQYQEWVLGRSEDTVAVVKGGSYKVYSGLDRESQALCTTRSFPFYTRPAYTTDTVYLYREGAKVDTVFVRDTSRTPYSDKPILTKKDFKDSLQFFNVLDSTGKVVGVDYALYSEYRNGGDAWLEELGNGLKYEADHVEVVFLTGEKVAYRRAASFYKAPSIGFRCCAYPE